MAVSKETVFVWLARFDTNLRPASEVSEVAGPYRFERAGARAEKRKPSLIQPPGAMLRPVINGELLCGLEIDFD